MLLHHTELMMRVFTSQIMYSSKSHLLPLLFSCTVGLLYASSYENDKKCITMCEYCALLLDSYIKGQILSVWSNLKEAKNRLQNRSKSCVIGCHSFTKHHFSPQNLPYRVQNVPILEYPEQFVVCRDLMKVGSLLIGKEQIRFPDGVQHRWVQIQRVIWVFGISEPGIVPLLTEEDVHTVVLQRPNTT